MMSDPKMIKTDRLRYTKNKLSSTLAILAIVFDCLYFISLYSSDVGSYFYSYSIGASVVYNLLFLLAVFLSSEGVKSYKLGYAVALIAVGVMQIVRIFYIPMKAHSATVKLGAETVAAMTDGQFAYVVICLAISAAAAIAAGVIGIIKHLTLKNYQAYLAAKEG